MSSASSSSNPKTVMYTDLPKIFDQIKFAEVKNNKAGGQAQYAQWKNGGFVYVQLDKSPANLETDRPRTTFPFGISVPMDAAKLDSNRKDIPVSLPEDVEAAIKAFEEQDMADMARNSKSLWKKENPLSWIQSKYTSSVKKDSEGKYPARLTTKLNTTGNLTPHVLVYRGGDGNANKLEKGTWQDLNQKGAVVLDVVRYAGRWFGSGKFGPVWEQANVIIFPRENQSSNFMFSWQGDMPEIVSGGETNSGSSGSSSAMDTGSSSASTVDNTPPVDSHVFSPAVDC